MTTLDRDAFQKTLEAADLQRLRMADRLNELAAARRLIVYSYGVKGKDLALQLRAAGVECLIYDNSPASIAKAEADGFETTRNLEQKLPLVIAAGQNQIEIAATLYRRYFTLAEALYAFDLRNSYGRAREFSAQVVDRADEHYAQYLLIEPAFRETYLSVLRFRASLDISCIAEAKKPVGEMWNAPIPADSITSFCDVGAFDGDTLISMKAVFPKLSRSFTVEPNPDLIAAIERTAVAQGLANENFAGVAWDKRTKVGAERMFNEVYRIVETTSGDIPADRLDAMTGGAQFDYVKLDVEGAEGPALEGGRELLRQARCIAIASYHLPGDILELPALTRELLAGQDWRCGFAHYAQSFDDSIFYFFR